MKTPLIYLGSIVVGCLGGGAIYHFWPTDPPHTTYMGHVVPIEGLIENQHNVGATVDPERGHAALKKIYASLVSYRNKNHALPTKPKQWLDGGYGITRADLDNPDLAMADGASKGMHHMAYVMSFFMPRADGSAKPAFPKAGERDVWAYCPIYVRANVRVDHNMVGVRKPTGAYQVLWSDGKIEDVPVSDLVVAPTKSGGLHRAFKGETGLTGGAAYLQRYTARIKSL